MCVVIKSLNNYVLACCLLTYEYLLVYMEQIRNYMEYYVVYSYHRILLNNTLHTYYNYYYTCIQISST